MWEQQVPLLPAEAWINTLAVWNLHNITLISRKDKQAGRETAMDEREVAAASQKEESLLRIEVEVPVDSSNPPNALLHHQSLCLLKTSEI